MVGRMNPRRLEVLLPADVSAHDYAVVTHSIWAVLDVVGLDDGCSLRTDEEVDEEPQGDK
jgi:hypothetical protein